MLLKMNLKQRRSKGAAIIGLTIAIFIFLLCIGLFCFDASRAQMAQRELVALCDSAALTGTSMLASYDVDNDDSSYSKLYNAQQSAELYAINMVRYGSILGQGVNTTNSTIVTSQGALFSPAPATGNTNIFVQYVDSANGYTPVDITNPSNRPSARAVQMQCCYGYKPVFFSVFNIVKLGTYLLNASSVGGLPQVDTVMAFDFSGSMDDQTYVTFVNRVWNNTSATTGNMEYRICRSSNTGLTDGSLFCNQIGWNYSSATGRNGFAANTLPPQNICFLGSQYAWPLSLTELPDSNHTHYFDAQVRSNFGSGVPATDDFNNPPGNCYAKYGAKTAIPYGNANYYTYLAGTYTPGAYSDCNAPTQGTGTPRLNAFTDLVVNIDDPQVWQAGPGGGSAPTYPTGGWIQPIYPRSSFQTGPFTGLPSAITFSSGTYTVPDVSNPGTNITLYWEPDTRLRGQTFTFGNIATLIEAARGNMEDNAKLSNAYNKGGSTLPTAAEIVTYTDGGSPTTSTGPVFPSTKQYYQLAYQRLAMLYSQPIATAMDGAYSGFYQKLNVLADCRYGFVGFSAANPPANLTAIPGFPANTGSQFLDKNTNSYVSPVTYSPYTNRSYYYGSQTTGSAPTNMYQGAKMPRYQLSATSNQTTEFLSIVSHNSSEGSGGPGIWSDQSASGNGLQNGTPLTGTHIGEALQCCADEFTSGGSAYDWTATSGAMARPAARRAVILFTDGEPTDGTGPIPTGSVVTACSQLKSQGCSLFCVGLNVNANPVLQVDQANYMSEDTGGSGLCKLVGNNSKFFPCTDSSQVKKAFSAVVRRLTQGQK